MCTRPFEPNDYGGVVAGLLTPERVPELGPGRQDSSLREQLAAITPETLLGRPPADQGMARACISALWLYHDFLDESHKLSQTIEGPTGSYWHSLMHRREPDFDNARYWFRRVGTHAIFPQLTTAARECAQATDAARGGSARNRVLKRTAWLGEIAHWDPFAFIDACQECIGVPGPDQDLCRRISLVEWQLLFDFSYRRATGTA